MSNRTDWEDLATVTAERDALAADYHVVAADRDRWREDSMRQSATINRLAAAAEDRNEVDANRQELHEADLRALAVELAKQKEANKILVAEVNRLNIVMCIGLSSQPETKP